MQVSQGQEFTLSDGGAERNFQLIDDQQLTDLGLPAYITSDLTAVPVYIQPNWTGAEVAQAITNAVNATDTAVNTETGLVDPNIPFRVTASLNTAEGYSTTNRVNLNNCAWLNVNTNTSSSDASVGSVQFPASTAFTRAA